MNKSFLLLTLCLSTAGYAKEGEKLITPDMRQEMVQKLSLGTLLTHWPQDQERAIVEAQQSGKPLLIAFLGENWCPWSEKLVKDVLSSNEFYLSVKEKVVLLYVPLKAQDLGQKMELKEQLQIDQTPSVVLVDMDGEEMARLGFLPISPHDYAKQLIGLMGDYNEVKSAIESEAQLNEEQLLDLYGKASRLTPGSFREKILEWGLAQEKGSFFAVEKYANLLGKLKLKHPEVQKWRKKILDRDPQNLYGTQLKVALLEFEKAASRTKSRPEKTVAPLLEYVKKFGPKDEENRWKVEMMIAQYFYSKNRSDEALEHAKACHRFAPETSKAEISSLIDYLQKRR